MKAQSIRSMFFTGVVFAGFSLSVQADMRFVSPAGLGVKPYATPLTASHSIQAAIDLSSSGDEILVAPGRYQESIDFQGKSLKVQSLYRFCGDKTYIANTIIDGGGTSRVVNFSRHETPAAVLQGFTITQGWCPPLPDAAGKITTCGAGILCDQSSPTLKDLILFNNEAGYQGGGLFCYQSTSLVENVELIGNRAPLGGGVSAHHGATRFLNVKLQDNRAGMKGGGMYLYYSDAQLRNVLVAQNNATAKGGGLFLHYSNPNMENLTVVNNTAPAGMGGGMNLSYVSAPTVKNSIFWGNQQEQIAFDPEERHMALTISYSDIQGGLAGVVTNGRGALHEGSENQALDPWFAAGGYELASNSPCIDRGRNEDWMSEGEDLAGQARVVNYIVDLGAYEYAGAIISPSNVVVYPPARPFGAATGTVGSLLNYWVGGAHASDGSPVEYLVDWGDGAFSGWSAATNFSHAWSRTGSCNVRAQARAASDTNVISSWSPSLAVTIASVPQNPMTLYVSPNGTAEGGYTNWTIAARSIQAAINACSDGDEVLVAPGVYRESINFMGKAITVQSLYGMSNDHAYIANTIIDGGGSNRVVVFNHGETAASVLRGFTITNGWGAGLDFLNVMSLYSVNAYSPGGGGILCHFSSPTLQNLIVTGNASVDGDGGGIYFEESMSRVEHVELRDNVGRYGGAIRIHWGTPSFFNVKLIGNHAAVGGALFLHNTDPQLRNVLVAQNSVEGLFLEESSPRLENVTVADNAGPGMTWSLICHPVVKNSIFWGNSSSFSGPIGSIGSSLSVSYSDIQGGPPAGTPPALEWGPGNLEVIPAFVAGGYALGSGSFCADVGTNENWMYVATDLDGNHRIFNNVVDMGAYECMALSSGGGQDVAPPSIVSLMPPDGYVGLANLVSMQLVVTDNVSVAGVTVNGGAAVSSDQVHFSYTANGIWGLFNDLEVVAQDPSGNRSTQHVNYAQCSNVTLYALWEDHWMVLNPFTNAVAYQWHCTGSTNIGFGVAGGHGSSYFTTTGLCESIEFQCPGYLVATRSRSSLSGPSSSLHASELDSDGDGISNGEEDTAGTDLNDDSSFFGMGSASLSGGDPNQGMLYRMLATPDPRNPLTFSWPSAIGRLYTIERSADLLDWALVPDGENLPGTGGVMTYTDSSEDEKIFLRVKAQKAR